MEVRDHRQVAAWLFACCFFVFLIIVVGGVTRLTHSGLSIVEWQPLIGTIPPLSEADWLALFEKYKLTPEYRKVNFGMSLQAFKAIFWWEYIHRLIGRLIGLVFFVPLLWFALRRKIDEPLAWRLAGIFLLGGLQGAMGWYMVRSGLVDDPRVSHFRLTAHLGLAFLILAAMLWTALGLLHRRAVGEADAPALTLRRTTALLVWIVFAVVLTGGLVAGIRAGKAYNTFPLMNGHVVPPEILMLQPWWMNFFYNMATVQFDHRLGAWLLVLLIPILWWRSRAVDLHRRAALAFDLLLVTVCIQFALGIATVLLRVPPALGVAHQAGAVLLFTCAIWVAHETRARAGYRR
jgi:cytochrome c oxidase assembly protein subunit 15